MFFLVKLLSWFSVFKVLLLCKYSILYKNMVVEICWDNMVYGVIILIGNIYNFNEVCIRVRI